MYALVVATLRLDAATHARNSSCTSGVIWSHIARMMSSASSGAITSTERSAGLDSTNSPLYPARDLDLPWRRRRVAVGVGLFLVDLGILVAAGLFERSHERVDLGVAATPQHHQLEVGDRVRVAG